jgi:multicomponent Na+:H+ antiporter subunit B
MYVAVGILGISISGSFLANFLSKGTLFNLLSSGNILLLNIIIGIKVAMGLFTVVWTLAIFRMNEGGEK